MSQIVIIDNYMIDLYMIFWALSFLIHGIIKKAPIYFVAWAGSLSILCVILFLDAFVNKGYCLFSSCQPTEFIKTFINTNLNTNIINFLRGLRITITFLVIIKMHRYIEHMRSHTIKI